MTYDDIFEEIYIYALKLRVKQCFDYGDFAELDYQAKQGVEQALLFALCFAAAHVEHWGVDE